MSTDTTKDTAFDNDELDEVLTPAQKAAATKKRNAEAKALAAEEKLTVELTAQDKKALDRKVEDVVDKHLNDKAEQNAGVEDYKKNGGRRWRCLVESTRPGVQHFEMIIADPKNPRRPVKIQGRCGMIIEEGLTKFVIDHLKGEYRTQTQAVPQDPTKESGLLHKQVRIRNYTVDIFEEIENPKPVGSVK